MQMQVTEYRAQVKACPSDNTDTRGAFPVGVKAASVQYGPMLRAWAVYLHSWHLLPCARTCQILSDLLGTTFSQASLHTALQESSTLLDPALDLIKAGLIEGTILHNDETGFRVAGKRWWLHVVATKQLTWYEAHRNRGPKATNAIGILPQLKGVSIHESLVSYLQYGCQHALCNAHYLRELTFVHEPYQQDWAKAMKDLLLEIKAEVELARAQGMKHLSVERCVAYETRYEQIVTHTLAARPPPERLADTRGRPPAGDEVRKLLCRLHDYQEMILRFLHQFEVPFDTNLAEQDLRMMKVQQKISGSFRTAEGATLFCRLRSYLSTLRKQGVHLLTALHHVFLGSPLLPSLGR